LIGSILARQVQSKLMKVTGAIRGPAQGLGEELAAAALSFGIATAFRVRSARPVSRKPDIRPDRHVAEGP